MRQGNFLHDSEMNKRNVEQFENIFRAGLGRKAGGVENIVKRRRW